MPDIVLSASAALPPAEHPAQRTPTRQRYGCCVDDALPPASDRPVDRLLTKLVERGRVLVHRTHRFTRPGADSPGFSDHGQVTRPARSPNFSRRQVNAVRPWRVEQRSAPPRSATTQCISAVARGEPDTEDDRPQSHRRQWGQQRKASDATSQPEAHAQAQHTGDRHQEHEQQSVCSSIPAVHLVNGDAVEENDRQDSLVGKRDAEHDRPDGDSDTLENATPNIRGYGHRPGLVERHQRSLAARTAPCKASGAPTSRVREGRAALRWSRGSGQRPRRRRCPGPEGCDAATPTGRADTAQHR